MRFQLGGTIYDGGDIYNLTLRMILQLQKESKDLLGRQLTMGELRTMGEGLDAIKDDAERAAHPDAMVVLAVTVWASRRLAGEPVTFEQAVDFPLTSLTFVPDPQDHKAVAGNPQKARPGKKVSGRAAANAAPRRTKQTSKRVSTGG